VLNFRLSTSAQGLALSGITATLNFSAASVTPKSVQPDANGDGGLVVTYQVSQQLPAGETVPISVYWANGPQASNALSVNAPHGQAKGPQDALYTYTVDSSEGPGTYTFPVSPNKLLTAPPTVGAQGGPATYLMVVANPTATLNGQSDSSAILAVPAHLGDLSSAQVNTLLPGGGQFAKVLSQTMRTYHIASLEQRAMFMGQIYVESVHLTHWVEGEGNKHPLPESWFITNYWTKKFTKWPGAGAGVSATVNSTGIVFTVPVSGNNPPATKAFDLKWALGSTTAPASSAARAAATTFKTVKFTKVGNQYTYTFTGAVPPDTGKQFPHLLVVDPATHKVILDLVNRLGNWSPADAFAFRGGGPIQLTGRHNYQLFADYEGAPAEHLMTTSGGKSPAEQLGDQTNPQLGFDAAGYFWEFARNLNTKTNTFAWGPAVPFNTAISTAINGINQDTGEPNGLQARLDNYLRIRARLLDPKL